MTIENEIKKLTAAVEANTAAMTNGVAPATAAPIEVPVTMAATPVESPVIDIPVEPSPDRTPEAAAKVADLKQITEGIVALCKAKGRDAAALLMAEYGAQKVPDLKKVSDKYDEILAKIKSAIEAK